MKHRNKVIIPMLLGSFLILGGCSGSSSSSGGGGATPNPAGTLQLSSATYAGPEGTANIVITVSRTGGTDGAVSVDYATSDGSATVADTDYTAIPATTLNWADGDGMDKTFNVVVNTADTNPEFTEDLTVTLSNEMTASLGGVWSAVVSITDDDSIVITGTVTAPSGSLASIDPTIMQRMFAVLFGKEAYAAISDLVAPVASATVEVWQVDASGSTVGSAITSATTDGNGDYDLRAPLDAPNSKYIVRATDMAGSLDGRITDVNVSVNPATDAASDLVTDATADLATISISEINEIEKDIESMLTDIDTTGTGNELSAKLFAQAQTSLFASNFISSKVAIGSLCGTVTKNSGADSLEKIRIRVRDFNNWVNRAKTTTAADGSYCVNVPVGDYIVGALNSTGSGLDPDRSAGEWWTSGGGVATQMGAEMVSVVNATPVTVDFDLAPGARIQGTLSSFDGGFPEGTRVLVLDYESLVPVTFARVKADGSYRFNVAAGDYLIFARNQTTKPYASQFFAAPASDNNNRNTAPRHTVIAGDLLTADMTLEQGQRVSGQVLDAPAGNPVTGLEVFIGIGNANANLGGLASRRFRTDKLGNYLLWLKPDVYTVRTRGQSTSVDLTTSNADGTDFNADVGSVTLTVQDGNSIPVREARAWLYSVDTSNATQYVYTNSERRISNGDGSVTLYAPTGNYKLLLRIANEQAYATTVYNSGGNVTAINAGTDVAFTNGMTSAMGIITLPTEGVGSGAGILRGIAPVNGTTSIRGGQLTRIRSSSTNNTTRFFTRRTLGDGSYVVAMPVGSYTRLRIGSSNLNTTADVLITDGGTTTGQN